MAECSLQDFRRLAEEAHDAIQEVLWFTPPSLHDHIKQYCTACKRTGTVPLNPDQRQQPDIEWIMRIYVEFNRFETRIVFECRYFGGSIVFHPTASGIHYDGTWIETKIPEQLFPSMRQSSLSAIQVFFQETNKAMKALAIDVQNEVGVAVQKCGDDTHFLFEKGRRWFCSQREQLKINEALSSLFLFLYF